MRDTRCALRDARLHEKDFGSGVAGLDRDLRGDDLRPSALVEAAAFGADAAPFGVDGYVDRTVNDEEIPAKAGSEGLAHRVTRVEERRVDGGVLVDRDRGGARGGVCPAEA